MPDASPSSSVVKPRKAKADHTRSTRDGYEYEKRWPRRRGRYEIEAQCAECQWWFDSFDPNAKKCRICDPPPPVEITKAPATSVPVPTVQQNQAPLTATNPSPSPGESTQLQWSIGHDIGTQYHTYSQNFGVSLGSYHSPGIVSSPPAGHLSNQLWGQDYMIPPPLPYSNGPDMNFMAGYLPDRSNEQGYNMPPDHTSYPTTLPGNPSMFTPNQMVTQEYNTLSNPLMYSDPAQGQTLSEEYLQQRDMSGLGITMPSQEAKEGSRPDHSRGPISNFRSLRPLRPLLPRETPPDDTASTVTVQPQKNDDKVRSGGKDGTRFRQSSYKQKLVEIAPKPDNTDR